MLTKILLAGLIPGAVAKPIAFSSSSAKIPFSTAAAEKPKAAVEENKRLHGTYPVAAVPYAVVPMSSVVSSVSSAASSVSTAVLPSTLAVKDTPIVPVLSVASYPVALPSTSVASIQSFPVQEAYVVKTPVVQPSLPVSTSSLLELPYSIKSPPVQVPVSTPTVTPTTLVQLPYSIKTPVIEVPVASYPVASPSSVVSSIKTPVASYAAAELPYGVKSAAVPYVASSHAVAYAASSPVAAYAASPPAIAYAASSPTYAASSPVAAYAASSPVSAYAASSPAIPYAASSPVSAYAASSPVAAYAASSPAIAYAASSVAALPYAASSATVSAVSAAVTPYRASSAASASYGVAPSAVSASEWYSDTAAPSAKDVCAQRCVAETCGDDKTDGFAECKALCITDCKVNGPSDAASSKAAAKNPAIPEHEATAPYIGAGDLTWESCMEACDSKFQYTEVTGPTYNGNQKCVKQCAAYRRSGAELYEKRDAEAIPERKVKSPPAEPKITAGTYAYEQCMKACSGRWQFTGVENTGQGESSCASSCARKYLHGAEVSEKRDVEGVVEREAKKVAPQPSQPEIIAGSYSYEQCVKACSGRWQFTGVGNTGQGESSCASGCARKFLSGAELSNKRDADELAERSPDIDVYDIVDDKREGIEAEVEAKTEELLPRKAKNSAPAGPSIFAGSEAFESCVKACKKKWQGTEATLNTHTGESHCAQSCSRGVKYGADAIVKRGAVPFVFEA